MPVPSHGITASVIQEMMPAYTLSNDLLQATFAALPPPPADASPAWRQARMTRLLKEVTAFMPADATQARLASQILIVRGLADTLAAQVHEPGVSAERTYRLSRGAAEMQRTGVMLERQLARSQQLPVPFLGTVLSGEVDLAALEVVWCGIPAREVVEPEVTPV